MLRLYSFVILASFLALADKARGKAKILKVAALELSPYITDSGEEHGYFYEIVTKAFADAGYHLDIQFYPPLRARKVVESGERDILLPTVYSKDDEDRFVFSKPLNGSSIGYIKFKDKTVSIPGNAGGSVKIGGSNQGTGKIESREKTLQLIDMLNQNRMDYIIADKLVAADILVSKRPHLVGKLEFTNPPLRYIDFHVAISKKNKDYADILNGFNRAVDAMKKNGSYEYILNGYGVRNLDHDDNTLVIGTVANADMKLLEELSAVFLKKHPNVSIQWNIIEENLLRRRIFSSIALHENVFDVITVGHNETTVYANKGWIEALANPSESYQVDDLLPVVRNDLTTNGRLYGLPFYRESSMTYYRADLFQKKGLTMPPQPDYRQIRDLAEKLHDPAAGVNGICLRGKVGWGENSAMITSMVKAFGGNWFDDKWRPTLTGRNWLDAVNFYVRLLHDFGPADAYRNGYNESLKLFADGHCAIWIDATVAASFLSDKKESKVYDKLGFATAPSMSKDRKAGWNWTWAFAIPKLSHRKALAQEFMEWATSKEYIELVAAKRGWLLAPPGTRISTYKNPNYQKAAPFSKFVFDVITNNSDPTKSDARLNPQLIEFDIPEFPALGNSFGNYMSDVLKKKRTVAEGLELSQQEARRIMYHSGYYTTSGAN